MIGRLYGTATTLGALRGQGGVPFLERSRLDALRDRRIREIVGFAARTVPFYRDWFARETGYPLERMNEYGSSLIYGHPQGPTGLRAIAELIEALRRRGGGVGLFTGCAAGDTGAALVLRVDDR